MNITNRAFNGIIIVIFLAFTITIHKAEANTAIFTFFRAAATKIANVAAARAAKKAAAQSVKEAVEDVIEVEARARSQGVICNDLVKSQIDELWNVVNSRTAVLQQKSDDVVYRVYQANKLAKLGAPLVDEVIFVEGLSDEVAAMISTLRTLSITGLVAYANVSTDSDGYCATPGGVSIEALRIPLPDPSGVTNFEFIQLPSGPTSCNVETEQIVCGCTNPNNTVNFDVNATDDDKSCEMCQDEDGDGECAQTTDACDNDATRTTTNSEGYCEDDYYCENPEAINYGDIGACHLIEEYICTDEDSDGTCAEEGDECDQDSGFTLKNNDGECAEERYCTDPSAENYGSVGDCQMPPDDTDPEVYE